MLDRFSRNLRAAVFLSIFASYVEGTPVRGVNLGGWLVLERWIKPSMMTSCMVDPPDVNPSCFWGAVPQDEWNYCAMLKEKGEKDGVGDEYLRQRLTEHWDTWVSFDELKRLHKGGVTHVRVPIGHWILGDIEGDEPYITGEWPFLLRLLGWARSLDIQVWLDLHTAPGSQNGFDNSGHLGNLTWSKHEENVARTVRIIGSVTEAVADAGFADVVTGFGLLNEPGPYVSVPLLLNFYEDGYAAVRNSLPDATVYIGDGFNSANYQRFWTGAPDSQDATKGHLSSDSIYHARYPLESSDSSSDSSSNSSTTSAVEVTSSVGGDTAGSGPAHGVALASRDHWWDVHGTALDTHMYHCFTRFMRSMTPKGHINEVCNGDKAWIARCCHGTNSSGSQLARLVGEWTVAYDQEPGIALESSGAVRPLTTDRLDFLRSFAMAQIVNYEEGNEDATSPGGIDNHFVGWFFWNFKMESPMYHEWDFLKGLDLGWMPQLDPTLKASEMFGSCEQILDATPDSPGVVEPFPPESWYNDDVTPGPTPAPSPSRKFSWVDVLWGGLALCAFAGLNWGIWVWVAFCRRNGCEGSSASGASSPPSRSSEKQGVQYQFVSSYGSNEDGVEMGAAAAAVPEVRRVQVNA